MLVEALDSHAYWQLSDESNRSSGYVLDDEQDPDLKRCKRLHRRLERLLP